MAAQGRPGMSDAEVADFVARFLPAYAAYLPGLYGRPPPGAREGEVLRVHLDADRSPKAPVGGLLPSSGSGG